ncbi:MAG: DUF5671 domain-containing protein [Patescibacteria group bacterium]|jgi:hypothetical protein
MGQEMFFSSLPLIGGIGFVAFIALGVSALGEVKHGGSTSDAVRRLYLYLASFITLLVVSVAVISLVDLGLRSWVFTKADSVSIVQSPPPTPYLPFIETKEAVPVAGATTLTCEGDCTLTSDQKLAITQWTDDYTSWKDNNEPKQQRAQLLVTAFSFLLIAGIAFGVHWFFALRDAKGLTESATRSTYLWAMSFVWLIATVVTLGFLLTTTLKGAFGVASDTTSYREPASITAENTSIVESFVTCGVACGLSTETVTLAEEWLVDYSTWNANHAAEDNDRSRHNSYASQLAIVLIALPQFGYHFTKAWRENKKPTAPTI